jgi:THO complex subunit 3
LQKKDRLREYSTHSSKVHSVDWSCDGKRLASGSFDKTVAIFTLSNDRLNKEHTCKGHTDSVDQLCWHPKDPDLLVPMQHLTFNQKLLHLALRDSILQP